MSVKSKNIHKMVNKNNFKKTDSGKKRGMEARRLGKPSSVWIK